MRQKLKKTAMVRMFQFVVLQTSQFLITICFYLKFLRFDNYIDTTVSKREESKLSYISINSRESAIFYQAQFKLYCNDLLAELKRRQESGQKFCFPERSPVQFSDTKQNGGEAPTNVCLVPVPALNRLQGVRGWGERSRATTRRQLRCWDHRYSWCCVSLGTNFDN